MSTTTPERPLGDAGISDVVTVSTSPTELRMWASSLLWSARSEASSKRRLGEVCLAVAVIRLPLITGSARRTLLVTCSPRINIDREHTPHAIAQILAKEKSAGENLRRIVVVFADDASVTPSSPPSPLPP